MNVRLDLHMDKPAFLGWVQGLEQRYELARGRVMMMTGGSRGHAIITRRLATALERRLDQTRWSVLTSDFGGDLGSATIRYPDVVVDLAGGALADLTATAPALIAEVLSPSSVTDDLGDKAAEYLHVPSLLCYLVLGSDAPKAWFWIRGDAGFSPGPVVIEELSEIIRVVALGIDLPLSEIYAGL
jgi:Uma2 family endonuclease